MSKQIKLDSFLGKKGLGDPKKKLKIDKPRQKHDSSREGSQATVRLEDSQEDVPYQTYQEHKLVCPAYILLVPTAMLYFKRKQRQLKSLVDHYSKQNALDFILSNLKYHQIDNLKNLAAIDDDDFWDHELPLVIEMTYKHIGEIDCSVRLLPSGSQEVVDISRLQVFVILGCMFLAILPKQLHESNVNFGQLMTIRQNQLNPTKIKTRQEKLKCFIAYFKHTIRHKSFLKGHIRLQRTRNTDSDFMDYTKMDKQVPLRSVEVLSLKEKTIEQFCGQGIMIDFANKRLGGGVLKNGCVQEQVLFCIFPEAVVSKIICEELSDNEAVIIYGARRFSDYTGYSDTFQYKRLTNPSQQSIASKSIMVAIDATDFTKQVAEHYQYSKKGIRREICKAVAGFQGAGLEADEDMPIVSGRWGCGAFRGDQDLKLLEQWVAASEASREMIYITDEENVKKLKLLVQRFKFYCTLDIIGILDQYYRARVSVKHPPTLMQYLKNYV